MNVQNHFVLLDDTLGGANNARALLFNKPKTILTLEPDADNVQIKEFFDQLLFFSRQGFFLAGFFAYELGARLAQLKHAKQPKHFDSASSKTANTTTLSFKPLPLAQFGVFAEKQVLSAAQVPQFLDEICADDSRDYHAATAAVRSLRYQPDFESYQQRFLLLQEELLAGNTYQTNLTLDCVFEHNTSPLALYRTLRQTNPVAYGGFLRLPGLSDGGQAQTTDILSFSPELFVKKTENRLVCKPIKGTLRREADPKKDQTNIEELKNDARFQAENVMIVDLIRNDLSQLAQTGSVRVDQLFKVESFSHLHHLVSEISAQLDTSKWTHQNGLLEVMLALFPCGSITGAPKLNTMKIIEQLEMRPRGVYTGAIGYIDACETQEEQADLLPDFCFNVAIRTLVAQPNQMMQMGVGGGVLHRADAQQEFDEIKLKSAFIHNVNRAFDLIETLIINDGVAERLGLHLDRLQHSAQSLGFRFDREIIQKTISDYIQKASLTKRYILRVSLSQQGQISLNERAFMPPTNSHGEIPTLCFYPERINSRDWLSQYKTSARASYERAHEYATQHGCLDALFVNECGVITEASRWNFWIVNAQGQWQTSPVTEGLLGGVMRNVVLSDATKHVIEQPIYLTDIEQAQALYLSNSVHGLVQVRLLEGCVFPVISL